MANRLRTVFTGGMFLLLAGVGCITAAPAADVVEVAAISDFRPDWRPLFRGVDLAAGRLLGEAPQAAYALRVDLHEPGVGFLTTPSNADKPLDTDGRTTSRFLEEFKCQAAVNASPFSPVQEGDGAPKDVLGLSVSRGDAYSAPNNVYGALIITKDNRARIAKPPADTAGAYNAAGGFGLLLEEGTDTGSSGERHPRTAAGVSKDGRYLYLLVVDGRQGNYSAGATTSETAQWLLRLGAWSGLNLDGGGSTSMVVADEGGKAQLVNRPIHNNIPGLERVNANHLGIYARPLK
ncbi:MAG TPA: phosphodiester glycosidase family protein [Candidatus Bathyarchaeia archaeon]|nr:phosphodiester glycosidase family protein [Candidatus Bathyarchaeia archaeon]